MRVVDIYHACPTTDHYGTWSHKGNYLNTVKLAKISPDRFKQEGHDKKFFLSNEKIIKIIGNCFELVLIRL